MYGSENFIEKIKNKYLSDKKDVELPQHNSMFKDFHSENILKKASQILSFDLNCIDKTKRLPPKEKEKRDCIIYLFWETGRFLNQKIGSLIGLTYSSIIKQVNLFKNRLALDIKLKKKYNSLKTQLN